MCDHLAMFQWLLEFDTGFSFRALLLDDCVTYDRRDMIDHLQSKWPIKRTVGMTSEFRSAEQLAFLINRKFPVDRTLVIKTIEQNDQASFTVLLAKGVKPSPSAPNEFLERCIDMHRHEMICQLAMCACGGVECKCPVPVDIVTHALLRGDAETVSVVYKSFVRDKGKRFAIRDPRQQEECLRAFMAKLLQEVQTMQDRQPFTETLQWMTDHFPWDVSFRLLYSMALRQSSQDAVLHDLNLLLQLGQGKRGGAPLTSHLDEAMLLFPETHAICDVLLKYGATCSQKGFEDLVAQSTRDARFQSQLQYIATHRICCPQLHVQPVFSQIRNETFRMHLQMASLQTLSAPSSALMETIDLT